MRIDQLMTQPVITCRADDDLNTAAHKMWEHDVGALAVVNDEGTLIGILTDRDAYMGAYTQGRALREVSVFTVMAKDVHACGPEDAIEKAEELMARHRVHRIPVVASDGEPIGMLSTNDLVRALVWRESENGGERKVLSTLAAICEPRHQAMASAQRGELAKRGTRA